MSLLAISTLALRAVGREASGAQPDLAWLCCAPSLSGESADPIEWLIIEGGMLVDVKQRVRAVEPLSTPSK